MKKKPQNHPHVLDFLRVFFLRQGATNAPKKRLVPQGFSKDHGGIDPRVKSKNRGWKNKNIWSQQSGKNIWEHSILDFFGFIDSLISSNSTSFQKTVFSIIFFMYHLIHQRFREFRQWIGLDTQIFAVGNSYNKSTKSFPKICCWGRLLDGFKISRFSGCAG